MKIYTLYLNTAYQVGMYKPVKVSDSANVSWFIDWDNFFGRNHQFKHARVKYILKSRSSTSYSFDSDLSTLRCNLSTFYQNQSNGCVLGLCNPTPDSTTTTEFKLEGDTSSTDGVMINIPIGVSNFTLQLFGGDENIITLPDDYLIMIFFEIDE